MDCGIRRRTGSGRVGSRAEGGPLGPLPWHIDGNARGAASPNRWSRRLLARRTPGRSGRVSGGRWRGRAIRAKVLARACAMRNAAAADRGVQRQQCGRAAEQSDVRQGPTGANRWGSPASSDRPDAAAPSPPPTPQGPHRRKRLGRLPRPGVPHAPDQSSDKDSRRQPTDPNSPSPHARTTHNVLSSGPPARIPCRHCSPPKTRRAPRPTPPAASPTLPGRGRRHDATGDGWLLAFAVVLDES